MNIEDKYKIEVEIYNGDFEKGTGIQVSNGWVGEDYFGVCQMIYGDPTIETSFDDKYKHSGKNSLKIDLKSLGINKGSLILIKLRAKIKITEKLESGEEKILTWEETKEIFEKLKLKLEFWSNTNFSNDLKIHKIYLTNDWSESTDVPSLCEVDFNLNTLGIWERNEKIFEKETKNLTEELLVYICLGHGNENSHGIANFDDFKISSVLEDEKINNNNNQKKIDHIEFNSQNFNPIPPNIVHIFADFLRNHGFSGDQIDDLSNDPTYPFSALLELWNREGLNFNELIAFTHINYPNLEIDVTKFLELNDVYISAVPIEQKEPTLREVFLNEYGERTSTLLLFYIKILLSVFSSKADELLDSPVSESSAQLTAITQSFKEKTNNVDQLRTLDLIETAIEKYNNNPILINSNVLTEQERFDTLPSLEETNKVTQEQQNSTADAIMQLIDRASANRIPDFEFRIGDTPLPKRSQQKMDYVVSVLQAIDKDRNRTDYSKWLPGYFDVGGGVVNEIVSEATRRNILQSFFETSIDRGLEKYSTLDANVNLRKYLASSLSSDIADRSYGVKGVFNTMSEFVGALFTSFSDDREKDNFETYFTKKTENLTKDALEKGYIDNDGNYHNPIPMDSNIRDFSSSAASTAAYQGINDTIPGLNNLPYNISDTVGVNPIGDFYPNSLGSVYQPDEYSGITNSPLSFYPSIPSKVGEKLNGVLPESSINSIKESVFNNPNLYQNSRFDGSFKDYPQFKETLTKAGISDFRVPQIKDAVNYAFSSNAFERANQYGPLAKLNTVGNELLGGLSRKAGIPFSSDYSPVSNLVPWATAPFAAAASALGKNGIQSMPGNKVFYNDVYGPNALANRNYTLPTNYSPDVMSQLMQRETPFASPVSMPETSGKKYSPEQLQAYKKYQEAMKNGSYGKNKPQQIAKGNDQRQRYKEAQEAQERTKAILKDANLASGLGGAVVGFALGSVPLAFGMSFLGADFQKIVNEYVFGQKPPSKWKSFTNGIGEFTGLTGIVAPHYSITKKLDSSGNLIGLETKKLFLDNTFYNKTFGRIFGKSVLIGGADLSQIGNMMKEFGTSDMTEVSKKFAKKYGANLFRFANHGLLFERLFELSNKYAPGSAERLNYESSAQTMLTLRMNYEKLFGGIFFNKNKYLESIGIDPTITNVYYNPDGSIQKDSFGNVKVDRNGKLSSEKLSGKFLTLRGGFGSLWSGSMGLLTPLRSHGGMLGAFNYLSMGGFQSGIKLGSGIQSLYSLMPKRAQEYLSLVTFGGKTTVHNASALLNVVINGIPQLQNVYDKSGKVVGVEAVRAVKILGYKTGFGKVWDYFFKMIPVKDKDGNIIRKTGLRAMLFGESYNKVFQNKAVRWYFRGAGFFNKSLSFLFNPADFIKAKLKEMLFNTISYLTKKITVALSEKIFSALIKFGERLAAKFALSLGGVFAVGCLIVGVIMLLGFIAISPNLVANNNANRPGVGGGGNQELVGVPADYIEPFNISNELKNKTNYDSQNLMTFSLKITPSTNTNLSDYSSFQIKYSFNNGSITQTLNNIKDAKSVDPIFTLIDNSDFYKGFQTAIGDPTNYLNKEYQFDITFIKKLSDLGITDDQQPVFCTVADLSGSEKGVSKTIGSAKLCLNKNGEVLITQAGGICPLDDTSPITCGQPGNGSFSHHRMRTIPVDISRSGPEGGKARAVVSGILMYGGNPCAVGSAGDVTILKGDDGIWYYYYHTEGAKTGRIEKGEYFARLYDGSSSGCWDGRHLHIEVFDPIDKSSKPIMYPGIDKGKKLNSVLLIRDVWKCNISLYSNSSVCSPGNSWCDPSVSTYCKSYDKENQSTDAYNDNIRDLSY